MQVEYEVLDLTSNYVLAKSVHEGIFDDKKDSFFTSWAWIDSWVSTFNQLVNENKKYKLKLVLIKKNKKIIAMLFCGIKDDYPFIPFFSKKAFLGATGIKKIDDIFIEKNNILFIDSEKLWTIDFKKLLSSLNVQQLSIPGIDSDAWSRVIDQLNINNDCVVINEMPTYIVDLVRVRNNSCDFVSILSSNKRRQINRTIKYYGGVESLSIDSPSSLDEALIFFDELVQLHDIKWRKKQKKSSFSTEAVVLFHRQLIFESWGEGKICLYRVSKKDSVIGCLYGFISNNSFLFYQSAFSYVADNKIKTGLICHSLLINNLAQGGLGEYDFLAGASQYKKSLSTGSYSMSWVDVYKYQWQCSLVKYLFNLKRRFNYFINILKRP